MKFRTRVIAVAVVVLAGGCATTRYSGRVIDDSYQSDVSRFRNRYEIRRLSFGNGHQPFFRMIVAGDRAQAKRHVSFDINQKSNGSAKPLPIAVDISPVMETHDDGLFCFMNFISLGLFPYSQERTGRLKVTVSPMDSRRSFNRREFTVACVYKYRHTPFFGIWPYLPDDDECVWRTEYAGPQWNGSIANEVYFGSVGRGLSKVLSRIDANLAMQGETKEGEDNAHRMRDASLPEESLEEKADKRSERMKEEKCAVCGSKKDVQGRCPLCSGR
jgi:hypothetical protein